jgi:hypothetical protein
VQVNNSGREFFALSCSCVWTSNSIGVLFVFCSAATGVGRCKVDNAGCWQEKRGDIAFSACQVRFIRVFYTV